MPESSLTKDPLYKYRGVTCLNCNFSLDKSDRFCSNCGQKNSTKKLHFGDLFIEFFSGLFSYDSRFQRTLRVLLFKPGRISIDYINGKRMRYANPFRFFLSASIIFFLFSGISDRFEGINFANRGEEIQKEVEAIQNDSLINKKLKNIAVLKEQNIQLDSIIKNAPVKAQKEESYKDRYVPQKELDTMNVHFRNLKKLNIFYHYYQDTETVKPEVALKGLEYEQSGWNTWLYKMVIKFELFYNNPKLFADYFINKLPFFIFFYLPVFALFIWLLYIRRSFSYMEHLVFAFHVQTTLFVLYIIGYAIDSFSESSWGFNLANFIFIFYLYKSMRNFYGQGRVKTILKFIILNIIFFTLAIIATIIAVIVSFSIF